MRIAVMSDIHGNLTALDAVLEDAASQGDVDGYWILGDIVALGPAPVAVLERLGALPNVRCVRGNTDRYVCTGDRPAPYLDQVRENPALLPVLVEVEGTFAWTQGAVTQGGWLDWLSGLPLEMNEMLPDGRSVLGVHTAPGRDEGLGFQPDMDAAALDCVLGECDADLVLVGHTHRPVDITVRDMRIVNVGCVSNPAASDLRAHYVILDADETGYQIIPQWVDYDRQAVIDALSRLCHPGAEFIIRHMRGEWRPGHKA